MLRVLLLLVMALSQAQPLAAALLCEQHHAAMHGSCMGDPAEHHHTTAPASHDMPASHDCAAMMSCSVVVPAILPPTAGGAIASTEFRVEQLAPTAIPATSLRTPPFHPPKA
ncbi:MAG TPA: hypothetical protein VFN22_00530 [Gemmatimonadales bacterium]|nr:hypothetical protein [Gemmatimonadales bacterium]